MSRCTAILMRHFLPNQIALSNFIASGDFERHLRKLVKINEHKYNLLLKSIHTFLSSYMDVVDTPAGSHIIVRIRNCTNQQKLIDALCEKSISIYGVQQYFHTGTASEDIFHWALVHWKNQKFQKPVKHWQRHCPSYYKIVDQNIYPAIYPETYFQPPFSPQSVWGIIEAVIFSTFYGEYL